MMGMIEAFAYIATGFVVTLAALEAVWRLANPRPHAIKAVAR